jgi:hypothetical protein
MSPLPSKCQKAIDEIEAGMENEKDVVAVELTSEHSLFRLLEARDFDQKNLLKPVAFDKQDLSLYATGPDLPEFNIETLLDDRFINAAKISAAVILKSETEKMKALLLKHDPFTDPKENQHDNHARLICTKDQQVSLEILRGSSLVRPVVVESAEQAE